jgi:mannose-6-phosphate isomerase-like protein (cupin superfamily)
MAQTKGFFVGKTKDFAKRKGWFFGHFADEPLLRSDLVEVAWQDISGKLPEPKDRHYHRASVEINIVIRGTMRLRIEEREVTVKSGEFFVIWPETMVDQVEADQDTEVIVVRAPSLEEDKVTVS